MYSRSLLLFRYLPRRHLPGYSGDFPAFISCVKTNGGMVDTKEDFMKLDPVEIFSDEMEAAIGKVDVDTLEPVMAGIVLGDGVPNIILGITVDGELAITGMNY